MSPLHDDSTETTLFSLDDLWALNNHLGQSGNANILSTWLQSLHQRNHRLSQDLQDSQGTRQYHYHTPVCLEQHFATTIPQYPPSAPHRLTRNLQHASIDYGAETDTQPPLSRPFSHTTLRLHSSCSPSLPPLSLPQPPILQQSITRERQSWARELHHLHRPLHLLHSHKAAKMSQPGYPIP